MVNLRKVPVKNRTEGRVGYEIPSLRVSRSWRKVGDVLYIPIDELIELRSAVPGGRKLLEDYLLVEDEEAIAEIFDHEVAPEYFYSEKEIEFLLYEAEDEPFLDCLDYAPLGVLNLIQSFAIKKKPNTTAKVDAINKKMKINLNLLIENSAEAPDEVVAAEAPQRRAAPVVVTKNEKNKSNSKYKIIEK